MRIVKSLGVLAAVILVLTACQPEDGTIPSASVETAETQPPQALVEPSPDTRDGRLLVEIEYAGQWYRKTFNYDPDAPNIRHLLYVVPEEDVDTVLGPGWAFTSLAFTPYPEPLTLQEDRLANASVLKYVIDAPGGLAELDLPAGTYQVAAAFIAAPLPPPGGDVILYPGVTGGGASTEFRQVTLRVGEEQSLRFVMTDENGWGYVSQMAER